MRHVNVRCECTGYTRCECKRSDVLILRFRSCQCRLQQTSLLITFSDARDRSRCGNRPTSGSASRCTLAWRGLRVGGALWPRLIVKSIRDRSGRRGGTRRTRRALAERRGSRTQPHGKTSRNHTSYCTHVTHTHNSTHRPAPVGPSVSTRQRAPTPRARDCHGTVCAPTQYCSIRDAGVNASALQCS